MSNIDEMRVGFETAFVDGNVASNLAYKPQFISNNYKEGKKVLSSIEDVIEKLDDNKSISDALGNKIVKEITEVARDLEIDDNVVMYQAIELLYDFIDDKNGYRFSSTVPKKKMIGKGIFNIGINCIENDCEDGVRRASNALGWFIIKAIEQGNTEVSKYLIELAREMLKIAIDMEISSKTQTFLVTLFTTVGMYCYKNPNYLAYVDLVIGSLKKVKVEMVNTAINLRTYENDMFSDLFGDRTAEYERKFRQKYSRMIKEK